MFYDLFSCLSFQHFFMYHLESVKAILLAYGDNVKIPPSTQLGTKALFKKAAKVKQHSLVTLHREKWSLHYDSKRIHDNLQRILSGSHEKKSSENQVDCASIEVWYGCAVIAQKIQLVLHWFDL